MPGGRCRPSRRRSADRWGKAGRRAPGCGEGGPGFVRAVDQRQRPGLALTGNLGRAREGQERQRRRICGTFGPWCRIDQRFAGLALLRHRRRRHRFQPAIVKDEIGALRPVIVVGEGVAQPGRRDRPGAAGLEDEVRRRRDDVIVRHLLDDLAAADPAPRLDTEERGERQAELRDRPVGKIVERERDEAGLAARRREVAVETEGRICTGHAHALSRDSKPGDCNRTIVFGIRANSRPPLVTRGSFSLRFPVVPASRMPPLRAFGPKWTIAARPAPAGAAARLRRPGRVAITLGG